MGALPDPNRAVRAAFIPGASAVERHRNQLNASLLPANPSSVNLNNAPRNVSIDEQDDEEDTDIVVVFGEDRDDEVISFGDGGGHGADDGDFGDEFGNDEGVEEGGGVIPVDLDNVVVITPPNIQQFPEDGGVVGGGAGGGGGKFNIHPSSSCFSLHALIS